MAKLITSCPSCNSGSVKVTKIECDNCGTKFEGDFDVPRLLKLPAEDLHFVENFLIASGSLKEMAKQLDISYPTVRNRPNDIIEELKKKTTSSKTYGFTFLKYNSILPPLFGLKLISLIFLIPF